MSVCPEQDNVCVNFLTVFTERATSLNRMEIYYVITKSHLEGPYFAVAPRGRRSITGTRSDYKIEFFEMKRIIGPR